MSRKDCCVKCIKSVLRTEYLTCKTCDRNVHKKCLVYGTPGDLDGDIFFDMTCLLCSDANGREVFVRKKLPWIMVVVLVIYNLSIKSPGLGNHGYYHYRIHITNFVYKNWAHLFSPDFKRKKNWVGSVAGTLSHFNRVYFLSGSEELGSNGWWKLIRNDTPLSYYYQYEESQKLRQSFMKRAATSFTTAVSSEQAMQTHDYTLVDVKQEEEDEEEEVLVDSPQKKIKTEDVSIDDLFEPITTNISQDDMPDISSSRAENFNFTWEEISQDLEEPHVSMDDSEEDVARSKDYDDENSNESAKVYGKEDKYPFIAPKSLFRSSTKPKISHTDPPQSFPSEESADLMTVHEEGELLKNLQEILSKKSSEDVPDDIRRFYRRLVVRAEKRKLSQPLHNIDDFPHLPQSQKSTSVLNRFHQLTCSYNAIDGENVQFSSRLVGMTHQELFQSPYSERILQPFIYRDTQSMTPWVKLMCELQYKVNRGQVPSRAPIDYCYVRPHHIPAVNALLQRLFWPGIDMSECLMYPDYSVVALYKQLIVGCAFLVPDVGHNETYISFMVVRPGWQKTGLGSFMLYHLTQTCSEKDITLHVSATNPAVFLYQKFGFKIEEMILDFYHKYLPWESKESRHAFFLRLRR
ncbi:Cysteine-rich protein 2-binding protein [Sergentomyia squamirostris]